MTDEEVQKMYEELQTYYGNTLANFEHHPRQFAHQVRLYKYYKEKETQTNQDVSDSEKVVDFT